MTWACPLANCDDQIGHLFKEKAEEKLSRRHHSSVVGGG